MWEMFVNGQGIFLLVDSFIDRVTVPYPGLGAKEVLESVLKEEGHPKPQYCPDTLYDLMKKCWKLNKSERPTFEVISTTIRSIIRILQPQSSEEDSLETVDPRSGYLDDETSSGLSTSVISGDKTSTYKGQIVAGNQISSTTPTYERNLKESSSTNKNNSHSYGSGTLVYGSEFTVSPASLNDNKTLGFVSASVNQQQTLSSTTNSSKLVLPLNTVESPSYSEPNL